MKITLSILISLLLRPNIINAGSAAGNGGDFKEMQFISLGYEALDLMTQLRAKNLLADQINLQVYEEMLRTLTVKFLPKVELNGEKRSGANYTRPEGNLVEVEDFDWEKHKDSPVDRFQFAIHETLPLIGVDDKNYKVSAPLVLQLKTFNYLERLTTSHNNFSEEPVLISGSYWDYQKEGALLSEMQAECQRYKERYSGRFFFVYCEYLEKYWYTKELEYFPVEYVYRQVRRKNNDLIIKKSWELFETSDLHTSYGLRVYGWGYLDRASWKVLGSSLGLANGTIDRVFSTERSALRACRERIREEKDQEFYYKAKCRSSKLDENKYYYQIVSQNPLVKMY